MFWFCKLAMLSSPLFTNWTHLISMHGEHTPLCSSVTLFTSLSPQLDTDTVPVSTLYSHFCKYVTHPVVRMFTHQIIKDTGAPFCFLCSLLIYLCWVLVLKPNVHLCIFPHDVFYFDKPEQEGFSFLSSWDVKEWWWWVHLVSVQWNKNQSRQRLCCSMCLLSSGGQLTATRPSAHWRRHT